MKKFVIILIFVLACSVFINADAGFVEGFSLITRPNGEKCFEIFFKNSITAQVYSNGVEKTFSSCMIRYDEDDPVHMALLGMNLRKAMEKNTEIKLKIDYLVDGTKRVVRTCNGEDIGRYIVMYYSFEN